MVTKKHQMPSSSRQRLIQQIETYLNTEQPELVAAYIFGSFVSDRTFKDVDIALLLESAPVEPFGCELAIESRIEQILRLPVDVRIMNNAPLSFQYQVFRDGKLIVDRSPNVLATHQGRVYKKYFEFSRFRKRYLKEVVHATL